MQAGDDLVDAIKPMAKRTMRGVLWLVLAVLAPCSKVPKEVQEPVLVSTPDGVGTKLRLAFEWNIHNTVGIDLVAMSANDILVQGAEPFIFSITLHAANWTLKQPQV